MSVQTEQIFTYKHSGNSGDIIYALAGIQHLWKETGNRAKMYIWINRPAFYYQNAIHPVTSDEIRGEQVMMNMYMFAMLQPLLAAQPYFTPDDDAVTTWLGQPISVDLDRIRVVCIDNPMPYGNIAKWPWFCYPDMACNLSLPWLHVEPDYKYKNYIIINRTQRYRNSHIEYFFLRKKGYKCAFAGTKTEYDLFKGQWNFDELEYIDPINFYQLAQYIYGCKLFLGNQSMCFAIAEALKVPRVLEYCSWAPNVDPTGDDAYCFLHQGGVEYYVDKLYKRDDWMKNDDHDNRTTLRVSAEE